MTSVVTPKTGTIEYLGIKIDYDLDKKLLEKFKSMGIDALEPDQFDLESQSINGMVINKIILSDSMNQLTLDKNIKREGELCLR